MQGTQAASRRPSLTASASAAFTSDLDTLFELARAGEDVNGDIDAS